MTKTKTCTKCGVAKPATLEYWYRRGSGLRSDCRRCSNAQSRAWAKANPEKNRANTRAWAKANPQKNRAKASAWQQANPEKARARGKSWRLANPERMRARSRQDEARRRARKKANGTYAVISKDQNRLDSQLCAHAHYSPCDGPLEQDHIIPLSRGGSHGIGNLQMLCRHHNSIKHDKLEVEVRARYLMERAA